jgi:acetylornithine deacetylase/succinyl-diaminopimelate desuccinylase-like protein
VPALACGPGILSVSHGPHEFVKMGRMAEYAKIYALTAARMLCGDATHDD